MRCFVTKNEQGIKLTIAAVSEDGKIVGTPSFEQIPEGSPFAGIAYAVFLAASKKPQPTEIPL